ncbi:TPA: regulatory protein GemA [Pasteurella multocida]|uniref:gp16 family protein n=2 Tax=Pasteurella multocida TaxID=747 RepID=UPI001EE16E9C|nr:regulatory protein GemA [Pasteurella multocida]MDX3990833.1 regulatory protein GemA [Pasteurella multocida]MDY0501439.1 regulatory protein GemA [Pasteurella multocida]MDY0634319.1 regulatory protein GemA [Pasteurella multocida]MDY0691888.1 regulatory protein GemA [Pasteurella multocida]BDE03425.1 Mu-like prophage FluMu protein gp16 [Pasteurella multocida]
MRYTKAKYIQLIHIAKHKLALDEFTYRAFLETTTGKTSCKQMKIAELDSVLTSLESKGFKNKATGFNKKRTTKDYSPSSATAVVKHDIALKIRAVWIDMSKHGFLRDGSEEALNQFVRNVINPILKPEKLMVLGVAALDYRQGTIVLERLKKWREREINKLRKGVSE